MEEDYKKVLEEANKQLAGTKYEIHVQENDGCDDGYDVYIFNGEWSEDFREFSLYPEDDIMDALEEIKRRLTKQ